MEDGGAKVIKQQPKRRIYHHRGWCIEQVRSLNNFKAGQEYFDPSSYPLKVIERKKWEVAPIDDTFVHCSLPLDIYDVPFSIQEQLLLQYSPIRKICEQIEMDALVNREMIASLLIDNHLSLSPQMGDFVLMDEDGLSIVYLNGRLRSVSLYDRIYLYFYKGNYHLGHWLYGTLLLYPNYHLPVLQKRG